MSSATERAPLLRYRVMAYVTGVVLILLVLVAMPLKYAGDNETLVAVIGPVHGFLYIAYVLTGIDLAYRRKWTLTRTVLVLLAGTVPFAAFFAERKVVEAERAAAGSGVDQVI